MSKEQIPVTLMELRSCLTRTLRAIVTVTLNEVRLRRFTTDSTYKHKTQEALAEQTKVLHRLEDKLLAILEARRMVRATPKSTDGEQS